MAHEISGRYAKGKRVLLPGLLSVLSIAAVGCSGSTEDPKTNVDFPGSEYTGDPSRIQLTVLEPDMNVGDISGFFVKATNDQGEPITDIAIACDSEIGVAIIEPTTNQELTDNFGQISGKIGCAAPGSYQFACRLPIGANKRQFQTIKCSGPIPAGFTGFPGAAGGGLGTGGSAIPPENTSNVRLSSVAISDVGQCGTENTSSIDIQQDSCDGTTAEPFFDTHASFTITNNSGFTYTFTSMNYTIDSDSGGRFTSSTIDLSTDVAAQGGSASVCVPIFDASSGGKRFIGSDSNISNRGVRNITFRLRGQNEAGDDVVLESSQALSFDDFNRCGG